jgi:RNA polymerase sigma-70 factor (ECF subfamily)
VTESTTNLEDENQSHCSAIDQALVKACLSGDAQAWNTFIQRFGRLIQSVVMKTAQRRGWNITLNEVDELTAEVFAQLVFRNMASLRLFAGRSTLPTYLTVIARRVTVHAAIHQNNRPKTLSQSNSFSEQPDRATNPHKHVSQQDEIEHYLKHLSAEDQIVLRMHDLEGHTYSEISRVTGIPINSIGPRLSKARKSIRQNENVTDTGEHPPATS